MKKKQIENIDTVSNPELVFGIVAPIGVNIDLVMDSLNSELTNVGYRVTPIKITSILEMPPFNISVDNSSYFNRYKSLISGADKLCEKFSSRDFLAKLAIVKIREERQKSTGNINSPDLGRAYVVRQFKRKKEIDLMRKTYGRKFIQISIYLDEASRRDWLTKKIGEYKASTKTDVDCETEAIKLIQIDASEVDQRYGQEVSEIFHRGDLFVDSGNKSIVEASIRRFVRALFGYNGVSPTKAEYGMYAAAAASLRSIDLSRQVGAAIFSPEAEVLTMGCNEVPKAFGGTYWEGEVYQTHRDFEEGLDANQLRKTVIIKDILERLDKEGFLLKKYKKDLDSGRLIESLIKHEAIKESKLMDIIEFGRIIHAEMSAITDAARTGKSVKDATMFVTTFPCHMCAKHIVSSGINRVVFLEPYPKSYAQKLHYDSITFEKGESHQKVLFEPFLGISPRRYRDIFEKGKRKDGEGKSMDWYEGAPMPRIEDRTASYIENEDEASLPIALVKKRSPTQASARVARRSRQAS
ncbi:anti-phage dCTP deaminase [Mesorhizobium sp. M0088]|uniref:anti-phage dCTP deaminase n=1 Tax=Mesorhizobium sp. M0088 TaxID=2956873 RepID=UPI00333DEF08